MAERDSFIFYKSFYDCIKEMKPQNGHALVIALCEYAFFGTEPFLSGLDAGIFAMMKPQIDANNKRYENGKKGGRPPKDKDNQDKTNGYENKKPNDNQKETIGFNNDHVAETKLEPNVNVNVNDNVNVNNTPISPVRMLEQFLADYPIPGNRHLVEVAYVDCLMSEGATEEQLLASARNYSDRCKILKTEEQYTKNPDNFIRDQEYLSYLPETYKPPKKQRRDDAKMMQADYGDFDKLEKELLSN